MDTNKQKLLNTLKETIKRVQSLLLIEKKKQVELIEKPISEIRSLGIEGQTIYASLRAHAENRLQEIETLHSSPFFIKCELENIVTKEKKTLYFAKHQFTEEYIYSWVAPVATIRFEKPGNVEYRLPDGRVEKAVLNNKEQYLIVDGKVVFYATESVGSPRELIYQEHFSVKKDEFILPEIVAVMEKAQDAVIRAHHVGPFIISGPAGSGKTTLALHRVAFLVQAPDTAHLYPGESIIVFVQDNGTKEYFSHLLPELGIKNVLITTFFEWATAILNIRDAKYIDKRGETQNEKDINEFERIKQIKSKNIPSWSEAKKFLQKNKDSGLDRIDLTIALTSFYNHHERFEVKTKFNTVVNGEIKEKTRTIQQQYSLMVIDEFQNYMPEQINLLNTCLDQQTKSVIYVGDIAQQINSGALRSWDQIGLKVNSEREVRLHKVYRNTKQILTYIQSLGYNVEIPTEIKNGAEVFENIIKSKEEIISYVQKILDSKQGIVGVIGKTREEIEYIGNYFKNEKRIHVTTMAMSQGVEYDTVCIVGVDSDFFLISNPGNLDEEFIEEKKRIQKDLLYVALTRAISELHVLGSVKLRSISQK